MSEAANASCGVRANEVRKAPRPHMAAVAPRQMSSTPSGSPQSAPKTTVVAPQTTKMDVRPVSADGEHLAADDGSRPDGRGRQAHQRALGALHEERAHAEPAADEEEDHRDGGREVVDHGLAAVAERCWPRR